MTVDTDRPIETGRTWQDLPPEPPLGDPLEPALVPPTEPPIAGEEAAATAPWRRVAAVLLLLIVALLLWLLLPIAGGDSEVLGVLAPLLPLLVHLLPVSFLSLDVVLAAQLQDQAIEIPLLEQTLA